MQAVNSIKFHITIVYYRFYNVIISEPILSLKNYIYGLVRNILVEWY